METMAKNTIVGQLLSYGSGELTLDIVIIIECFIALVLNMLIIFIICNHLWTPGNQLILSLAAGDASVGLVIPLIVCSVVFTKLEMDFAWELNCKAILIFLHVPSTVNLITLTAISIEGFDVVFFP